MMKIKRKNKIQDRIVEVLYPHQKLKKDQNLKVKIKVV
jgi:hypothetical protein